MKMNDLKRNIVWIASLPEMRRLLTRLIDGNKSPDKTKVLPTPAFTVHDRFIPNTWDARVHFDCDNTPTCTGASFPVDVWSTMCDNDYGRVFCSCGDCCGRANFITKGGDF